ncbi:regulator of G-protein signaling 12b [Pimephales promelas]|nr:regulator of G-protein signaling 12b [Pimephales promelas]
MKVVPICLIRTSSIDLCKTQHFRSIPSLLFFSEFSVALKNERRQRERTSVSKYSHRRAPSAPPPAPPPPPPPPPPRVRGGGKRAPLHMRGALDVDGIRCDDFGGQNGSLERVVDDLKTHKGRTRRGIYQTSGQGEMLPVKKRIDPSTKTATKPSMKTSRKKNNHSKNNATFV